MTFNIETKQENKISFLDVNLIREQGKFVTCVYRKLSFSGVYTQFDTYKAFYLIPTKLV